MVLTKHAAKQAQRRGVNSDWIDCVLQYGDEFKGGGGCSLFRISAKEQRFLRSEIPAEWRRVRDHSQVALVLTGNVVVTVMHRIRPFKKSARLN